ncbi:MAG: D-glycero-beta-D-manno-heptose 1-phosphate adenylyltransferase [Desulfobacterales bacterium]|nr:D-glycero-beta-D-manno-heptose 1-phosphate adenylyltransferase [Desulfobacterales bacterium]
MASKLLDIKTLKARLSALPREKCRIVFTNGCFDILHAGHIRYLAEAKNAGDYLVVGLNSDRSVRTIKGDRRPLIPQNQRAEVLSGLASVDYIIFFDEPDPYQLITEISPDVLVKGGDWSKSTIIGADVVEATGGQVLRIPFEYDISTSQIIQKIVERYGNNEETDEKGT